MSITSYQWEFVMPLGPGLRLEGDAIAKLPFSLTPDINLALTPERVKQSHTFGNIEDRFIQGSPYSLISKVTSPDPPDESHDDRLYRMALILWLAGPVSIQWRLVSHARTDSESLTTHYWGTRSSLTPHPGYKRAMLNVAKLELAKSLALRLIDMTEGPMWAAFRTLFMALQQSWLEGRYLLLWVALEAIYSADSEISFRIALRISKLLRGQSSSARLLFARMKSSYTIRSRIAHGQLLKETKQMNHMREMLHLELILRDSFRAIAADGAIFAKVQSKNGRGQYLDSLCF